MLDDNYLLSTQILHGFLEQSGLMLSLLKSSQISKQCNESRNSMARKSTSAVEKKTLSVLNAHKILNSIVKIKHMPPNPSFSFFKVSGN